VEGLLALFTLLILSWLAETTEAFIAALASSLLPNAFSLAFAAFKPALAAFDLALDEVCPLVEVCPFTLSDAKLILIRIIVTSLCVCDHDHGKECNK
jgi:hypothetical protein